MNAAQTECTLDTPESIGAMEFVIGMITDKIAAPVTDLANPSFAVEEFFGGKIGMHVDGPWQFKHKGELRLRVGRCADAGRPCGERNVGRRVGFGISNTPRTPTRRRH